MSKNNEKELQYITEKQTYSVIDGENEGYICAIIQLSFSDDEKEKFANISNKLGFSQTQLALTLIYSFVEMYKQKGHFVIVDLEKPKFSNERTKRLRVSCPISLKTDFENISRELGYSQVQVCLMLVESFVSNFENSGTEMFSNILSPEYRVKK